MLYKIMFINLSFYIINLFCHKEYFVCTLSTRNQDRKNKKIYHKEHINCIERYCEQVIIKIMVSEPETKTTYSCSLQYRTITYA